MNTYFDNGKFPMPNAQAMRQPQGEGFVGLEWGLWMQPEADNDEEPIRFSKTPPFRYNPVPLNRA